MRRTPLFHVALAMLSTVCVYAQTSPSPDVNQLAQSVVRQNETLNAELNHYAYTNTVDKQTFDAHKKIISQHHEEIQFSFLNGHAWARSGIYDGNPQTPEQLAAINKRIEIQETSPVYLLYWQRLLSPDFEPTITGHALLEGNDCFVLVITPAKALKEPEDRATHTFWINSRTEILVQYERKQLADYDDTDPVTGKPSGFVTLRGSTEISTFQLVDGVLLPDRTVEDEYGRSKQDKHLEHYHRVDVQTNFERFRVSVQIDPATQVTSPAPASQ